MSKLAVIILTCNEEKNIAACLDSVQFADERLVVDSCSTDNTVSIAEAHGARVVVHPFDNFAGQRNFAAEQTDADWILYLDADERITPALADEIQATVAKNEPFACNIHRINFIFGKKMLHGAHGPDTVCRLLPKNCFTWNGVVHESVTATVPIKQLKNAMEHYTYDSWGPYFRKFDQYTTLMAKKMYEQGKHVSLIDLFFRPPFAFFRAYILKAGFLDGELGFVFSVFHAYYTYAKYIKLRYINRLNDDQDV